MKTYQQLNFPAYPLRLSVRGGVDCVWDSLRRMWLVLTPEEWVRQHVIRFLVEQLGAQVGLIAVEHPVDIQGMAQRADVVVYRTAREPVMLVECKAPAVRIDAQVLAQAVRYNSVVGAQYLLLTNGMKHYFYEKTATGNYLPMTVMPDLG